MFLGGFVTGFFIGGLIVAFAIYKASEFFGGKEPKQIEEYEKSNSIIGTLSDELSED